MGNQAAVRFGAIFVVFSLFVVFSEEDPLGQESGTAPGLSPSAVTVLHAGPRGAPCAILVPLCVPAGWQPGRRPRWKDTRKPDLVVTGTVQSWSVDLSKTPLRDLDLCP